LVAAIRAGDSSIPGTPIGLENSLARLSIGADSLFGAAGKSPASRFTSLPSTPIGSIRVPSSNRKPSDQLSVIPDSSILGTSQPTSLQVPRREDDDFLSTSPTSARTSPEYVRSRARSQTLVSPTDSSTDSSLNSVGTFSSSYGPSSNMPISRANAPLGEAIRLQKMPASMRMAGDLYNRNESSNRLSSSSNASSGHGLGIGMSPSNLDARLAPQASSASPMMARSSSKSSSAQNSPVLQRRRNTSTFHTQAPFDPSPLSVQIPAFQQEDVNAGSVSAMPAVNYNSSRASPSMKSSTSINSPSTGQLSASQSTLSPMLGMPISFQRHERSSAGKAAQRLSVGGTDVGEADHNAQIGESNRVDY
jgi:hypothetical protein